MKYNPEDFIKKFSQTDTYKKLKTEYQHLFSEYADVNIKIPQKPHRHQLEEASVFIYSLFYYLDFLLDINPKSIADVGCGANFVKKYIPQIVGFDSTPNADFNELFDAQFVKNHYQEFDAAFSINSIHFISLKEFANQINQFGQIIKSGGRGFVACNLIRLLECTQPHEYAELFDLSKPLTADDYEQFIKKEIKKINYDIIVEEFRFHPSEKYHLVKGADWPTFDKYLAGDLSDVPDNIIKEMQSFSFKPNYNDGINGNIRLVFRV